MQPMYLTKKSFSALTCFKRAVCMILVCLLLLSIYPVPTTVYAENDASPTGEPPGNNPGEGGNGQLDGGENPPPSNDENGDEIQPPSPRDGANPGLNLNDLSSDTASNEYCHAEILHMNEQGQWVSVSDGAALGIRERLQVKLKYKVLVSSAGQYSGKLTFQIPSALKGEPSEGNLYAEIGGSPIGSIVITERQAIVNYNWSEEMDSHNYLTGEITFYATIEPLDIPEGDLTLDGEVGIIIHLEPDAFYKYSALDVHKNVSKVCYNEADDYYYLDYTIRLTAPKALTKAVVIDRFHEGTEFVERYMGIGSEAAEIPVGTFSGVPALTQGGGRNTIYAGQLQLTPAQSITHEPAPAGDFLPGMLVWTAYDMAAGETRVLQYRVKLTEDFSHQVNPTEIINHADAYSGSTHSDHPNIYYQSTDSAEIAPQAEIRLTKTNSGVQTTDSGKEYIDYTVEITAPQSNDFAVHNITIHDWFDGGTKGKLKYDFDSFKLDGEAITARQGTENWGNCAEIEISSLMRQSKVLTYRVWIDPSYYTGFSGVGTLTNSVQAVVRDEEHGTDIWLDNKTYSSVPNVGKNWRRKNVEPATTQELTIPMTGDVFDAIGAGSTVQSFTVPAKTYAYNIIVNESGDWEVAKTTFKDVLGTNMWYQGYAKIEAVDVSGLDLPANASESTVFATIAQQEAAKTVWLKVDGKTSFSFKPEQLGFPEGSYAYRLRYYARPMVSITMTAQNRFYLTDYAGKDGAEYPLAMGPASVDVNVIGTQICTLHKQAWYYTQPEAEDNFYENRITHYWIIKASGDLVQGLKIKDVPNTSHFELTPDSLVGVYIGKADTIFDSGTTPAPTLNNPEVQQALGLRALDAEEYSFEAATVTLQDNIVTQSDEQMFIILRTRMVSDISGGKDTDYYTLKNHSAYSYDGGHSWRNSADAALVVLNHNGSTKAAGPIYTYTGAHWEELETGRVAKLPAPNNTAPGLYVSWLVTVNTVGNIRGKATVVDTLPEGLELDYVSLQSIGSWLDGNEPTAATPGSNYLGPNFTPSAMKNEGVYNFKNAARGHVMADEQVYYDSASRTIVWSVDKLRNETSFCANYYVTFRVMARVVAGDFRDADVHSFINRATVHSALGAQHLESENHFVVPSLTKTGDKEVALTSGVYPFTLQANPTGLDLDPNKNTVVLVDELNGALIFEADTLVITNSVTGSVLSPELYSVSITATPGKTIAEFTLPDSTPLTIRYNTRVNAAPGVHITVSNKAYWKGYTGNDDTQVEDDDFCYEVSGIGTFYDEHPTLIITKKSSANILAPAISGAVYTLTPITINESGIPTGGDALSGTPTESGGVYTYDFLMYNTVYRVEETTAPIGYLRDTTRHYIAIANADDAGRYTKLLETIAVMADKGFHVDGMYTGDTMAITLMDAPDYRYSLTVRKVDGNTTAPLEGVGFTLYRKASENTEGALPISTPTGQDYAVMLGGEQITALDAQGFASVTFSNLDGEGTVYYLVETRGLYGYLISPTAIPIELHSSQNSDGTFTRTAYIKGIETIPDGKNLCITVQNFSKMDMPTSGVLNTGNTFLTFGAVFLIISIGILLNSIKQQYILCNKKERDH